MKFSTLRDFIRFPSDRLPSPTRLRARRSSTTRLLRSTFALLALLFGLATPVAADPFANLLSRNRVEADPGKEYRLTDQHGPWLILATTFNDEDAEKRAHDLVIELRRRYKLKAYWHNRVFDYSSVFSGTQIDEFGEPIRMQYMNRKKINEVAVLIGDFSTVDDPLARKTLEQIKTYRPDSLEDFEKLDPKQTRPHDMSVAEYRTLYRMGTKKVKKYGEKWDIEVRNLKAGKGPMASAFIVPNPILPKEYFTRKTIDKLVYDMNKDVPHSLLKCPGKYTIVVATFKGYTTLDQRKIKTAGAGKEDKIEYRLQKAAEDAHLLTESLAKKGYEVYEFHDRTASMVCIGSFDQIGANLPDGTVQYDPRVQRVMEIFGATRSWDKERNQEVFGKPKTLEGMAFDLRPTPVEVPRKTLAIDYDRATASR